jgi:FAD/FMN-containing dehydrogenase
VLKLLGPQAGVLSFPLEGYTLALDFRAGAATLALLAELDAIVAAHGGRIYLAKDARMDAAMMRKTYPRLAEFESLRRRVDPQGKFASLQSRRLAL